MALNPADACGLVDQSIPQWKRELIIRRRALGRTLQVGSSTVKLTCPAVVAVVRQPEIFVASDNAVTSKQKNSPTNEELLNQNRVDFHPSTSSAVSVGNMRLLDACSDVNNLVINGIDVKNKQSEVVSSDLCVNYNLIMGEDKSLNLKKKGVARSKLDQNTCSVNRQLFLINQVPNEGTNGKPIKDEDCLSDSSEELQYGPGIVKKLKTKYLSMTLREQKRHLRPSIVNLRRATSLENMLEGEGTLNNQNKTVVEDTIKTEHVINTGTSRTAHSGKPLGPNSYRRMKHLGSNSHETMKRARSMDTLLKSESRTTLKPIASIVNENIVIVENLSIDLSKETTKKEIISPKDPAKHAKRDVNIPADRELPPPDLVKQTLKIFETSPKKKIKPQSQTNLAKLVAGFSNSNSQTITSVSGNSKSVDRTKCISSKPILSPKPVLSPEKLRQNRSRLGSPKKSQTSNNTSVNNIHSPSKVSKHEKQQLQLEMTERLDTNTPAPDRALTTTPKVTSPRSISPIVTVVSNNEEMSPVSLSCSSGRNNSSQNFFMNGETKSILRQPEEFEEIDSSNCSKPVPESALENIRRGGCSMQFSFNNESSKNTSVSKSYLPRSRSPPQALNTSMLKEKLEKSPPSGNIAPLRSQGSPQTKQVGIIRPLVTTKIQSNPSTPILTEQEIEKNLINRVKSIEQPISKVVVAIKALPDNVVLGSVSSDIVSNKTLSLPRVCTNSKMKTQGLWDDKLWHQNQNTIVFNFSDRKEVPDYIENDGLILRGKRDRPRPGEGGFILLDSAGEESSTDADDPPSPCDVTFVGDNVLINGKSNLKKNPKQVKLRIQFNDEATTMFEYPSEASLVEEELSAHSSSSTDDSSSHASANAPTPGVPMSLGGSLGAYTPRQVAAGDWQLGVTPVQLQHSTRPVQPQDSEDHLKPAPPESTVVWSEDTASDLLF